MLTVGLSKIRAIRFGLLRRIGRYTAAWISVVIAASLMTWQLANYQSAKVPIALLVIAGALKVAANLFGVRFAALKQRNDEMARRIKAHKRQEAKRASHDGISSMMQKRISL